MKKIERAIFIVLIILLLIGKNITTYAMENLADYKNDYNEEKTGKYNENEIVVMYEEQNALTNFMINLDFNFNQYSKEQDIELKDIHYKDSNRNLNIALIKSEKYSTEELLQIFRGKDWVISAIPNYNLKLSGITNDTYLNHQWALENKGQNSGHTGNDINPIATNSDEEKVVVVLDSGVDYTHEDLKNNMWVNKFQDKGLPGLHGYDYFNNDDDPMDDNGHGTHCAGIIAAEANNYKGISGVSFGAENIKIMALKIFDPNGISKGLMGFIDAYQYIYKAQKLGVNIVAINNSWGSYISVEEDGFDQIIESLNQVIDLVGKAGAVSVCASGNDSAKMDENGLVNGEMNEEGVFKVSNVKSKLIPGGLSSDYIICVGASNEKDEIASFSNYGPKVDINAPGTDILSTINSDNNNINIEPSLLTENQKNEYCATYYSFDDSSEGMTYNVFEGIKTGQQSQGIDLGTVSLSRR